jgi:glycosyltransferase involved in cell wall biosynthesis
MAFGLPVLCYDRGGQTDFLKSDETGFVVPLNDAARFVQALKRLHADRAARVRYGQHNLYLVESYFIDSCARRYEEVFEQALERRLPAGSSRLRPHPNPPPLSQGRE